MKGAVNNTLLANKVGLTEELRYSLTLKKGTILSRWYAVVLASYPTETRHFLQDEADPFANPVGTTFYQGLEGLYDELLGEMMDKERLKTCLDSIIRIRAIQDFSPSQALAFVFQLKGVIKEELAGESKARGLSLETLETRLEELALMAFDIYVQCREQLYDLKVKEFKNKTARLLQRANLTINFPY